MHFLEHLRRKVALWVKIQIYIIAQFNSIVVVKIRVIATLHLKYKRDILLVPRDQILKVAQISQSQGEILILCRHLLKAQVHMCGVYRGTRSAHQNCWQVIFETVTRKEIRLSGIRWHVEDILDVKVYLLWHALDEEIVCWIGLFSHFI